MDGHQRAVHSRRTAVSTVLRPLLPSAGEGGRRPLRRQGCGFFLSQSHDHIPYAAYEVCLLCLICRRWVAHPSPSRVRICLSQSHDHIPYAAYEVCLLCLICRRWVAHPSPLRVRICLSQSHDHIPYAAV